MGQLKVVNMKLILMGDTYEYCAIWLYPTSLYEDSKSTLETIKNLGQEATAEQLKNYGNDSYVIHNKSEDQSIIHVLQNLNRYICLNVLFREKRLSTPHF